MANRYCELTPSKKISEDFQNINIGFDRVQQEMDANKADVDAHIADTGVHVTPADHAKLDGIEPGAQVNQPAFSQINDVSANQQEDALTIEGGTGIMITTNPAEKKVTITATGTATPGPHGSSHTSDGSDPIPNATTTASGLMSAADKAKLDEATPAATASTLMQRDTSGRAKVTDPVSDDDAATKRYVDSVPFNMARQAIINGNFDIWQRGTSFTNPATVAYLADRFFAQSGGPGTFPNITISRQVLTPGEIPNSFYYMRINTDGAGSSLSNSTFYTIRQKIENGTRYLCGSGKKITLSFWARSSIPNKKLAVNIKQAYGSGGTPTNEEELIGKVINLTATWTKYTATFTTNTLVGKTFGTNNDDFLNILFWIQWGTDFLGIFGGSAAETFGGAGTIDIAQVQVNAGDTALPFQPRSFAEELALCQRYYECFDGTSGTGHRIFNTGSSLGNICYNILFRVQKRIIPTMSLNYDVDDGQDINVAPDIISKDGFFATVNEVPAGKYVDFRSWYADAEL